MSPRRLTPLAALALTACAAGTDPIVITEPDFSADVADMLSASGCTASESEIVRFARAQNRSADEAMQALGVLEGDGLVSQRRDGRYELTGHGDCI